jgi:hypothetical protein
MEFYIEEKRSKELPLWVANLIIFIIGSALWTSAGDILYFIFFIFIWFILIYSILHWFPYRNLVGSILFKNDYIEINKRKESIRINHNDIQEIKLTYTLRKGLYLHHIDLGNNNIIEIKLSNDVLKYYLCIRGKREENLLKSALLKLYENKVNINESVLGDKTFGLEHLNYKEIQDFKAKY